MAIIGKNTQTLDGHGFQVRDVPEYLDDTYTKALRGVFKTRKSANNRANRDRAWAVGSGEVVDLTVEQVDGFEGLWFLVYNYTPERGALTAQTRARYAEADALAAARKAAL